MEIESLKEIGLTEGEVKVYLALLHLGSVKTGKLALRATVSSSKVYKILARLEQKGLVTHVIKGGVTHYKALEPRRILDYLDEEKNKIDSKRKTVESIIPSLLKQMKPETDPQATVYTGMKAVTNFFRNILDELKKGDVYYVIGARYIPEIPWHRQFFYKYHSDRAKKGIKVMMLANNEIRGTIVPPNKKVSEIRFLPDYLMSNMQILFYKNKTFMVLWEIHPVGFLIESEDIVKSFKKYFDAFWKLAEK
jgi:sugar-specific transcriptional regulator TrmB